MRLAPFGLMIGWVLFGEFLYLDGIPNHFGLHPKWLLEGATYTGIIAYFCFLLLFPPLYPLQWWTDLSGNQQKQSFLCEV
jgi:hypothetical protein